MKKPLILSLLLALLTGCGRGAPLAPSVTDTVRSQADGAQGSVPMSTGQPAPEGGSDFRCPLSAPTVEHPTDTDIFGDVAGAEWYCSADNELCAVKSGPWPAGGWKVGWRKPSGAKLEVSGRRLDASAPPLGSTVPDGYWGTFQSSGLIFPTEGCWEVEAQAKGSRVHFVVQVAPPHHPPRGGSCETLADVVHNSDHIMLASVQRGNPGPEGRYTWQSVRVERAWKNPYGDEIQLLQDTWQEPELEKGVTYLLFLQRAPFQLFCPKRTLAKVVGQHPNQRVLRVNDEAGGQPMWSADGLADIEAEISALLTDSGATLKTSPPSKLAVERPVPEVPVTATSLSPGQAPGPSSPNPRALPTANPTEQALASGTRLYLWSWESSYLSIIDPRSGHTLHTISLEGQSPGVVVSRDGRRLFVLDGASEGRLRVIDTATWDVLYRESVSDRALLLGSNPITLSGDGRWLLIEHYSYDQDQHGISFFDTEALQFVPDDIAGLSECENAFGSVSLVGRPGDERLYTTCGGSLMALDAATLVSRWRVPAPMDEPCELALAPDGRRLYGLFPHATVTYQGGFGRVSATQLQLWVWETSSGRLVQHIRLSDQVTVPTATFGRGDRGYLAAAPDGVRLYLAWEDRLWRIDAAALQVTDELVMPAPIDGLALSNDGAELYLLPSTTGDLQVRVHGLWTVDTATLTLVRRADDWPRLSMPFVLAAPAP